MNFDLSSLITQIDVLRLELGFARWSMLAPWSESGDVKTCDEDELERVYERLCIVWEGRNA